VDLTPIDVKRSTSRRHARIGARDGSFSVIEDVGTMNGTFVNGVRLTAGGRSRSKPGDTVTFRTISAAEPTTGLTRAALPPTAPGGMGDDQSRHPQTRSTP
jgi:pSer/pThr/pTyr-binding forkhead associated (FHA) protein